MLKISDHLYVDKKHIIRQIIEDLVKSIDKHLDVEYLNKTNDSYLYVRKGFPGESDRLILVLGDDDGHGGHYEKSRKIISEKELDIEKYHTAYNLMQLYLIYL